jgi:hypothetical protein
MILALNNNNNNYPRSHPLLVQDSGINNNVAAQYNKRFNAVDSSNITSSPLSNYTFQTTAPLSTTSDFNSLKRPNILYPPSPPVPDLMPSTTETSSWLAQSYQQTPRGVARLGHNRESSLSSLNSNGPASPYNVGSSNPQIAIPESTEAFQDLGADNNYSYQLGKPMIADNFYTSINGLGNQGHALTDMPFADGLPNLTASQQQQQQQPPHQNIQQKRYERLVQSADASSVGSTTRSHPASVASSTVEGDSQPATPSYQEPIDDEARRRKNGEIPDVPAQLERYLLESLLQHDDDEFTSSYFDTVYNNVPKLDRTMTDVYSDELYSPHFTITSASPQPQVQAATSPNNGIFAERLALANNQHLSAVQSPVSSSSRTDSPFRQGSPLAPSSNDFSQNTPQILLNSAQHMREKQKQERDAKALREQLARSANQQQGTPSTISPKDAMLDFNDGDDASNFPLFTAQETSHFDLDQLSKAVPQQQQQRQQQQQQSQQQHKQQAQQQQQPPPVQQRTPLQTAFDYGSVQMPQQYPFIARPRQPQQGTPSVSNFSRMNSVETNGSSGNDAVMQRPARTNADGGTYTCTYHGCTLRFETPQLLQKHKREGHRQANALTATRPAAPSPGIPDMLLGSQAGPHRCDRINPSTGKPCNTVFSRPYDLTRHEDTIHNARKKKVRCNLCTEEKTFSRADALTRHYRVCHPDVEFPGKHRRRGGSAA